MNFSGGFVRKAFGRTLMLGGVASCTVIAFPKFEDWYWSKKDPKRVTTSDYCISDECDSSTNGKRRLVILGSGWGSCSILKHIDRDKYDVTLISPRNYFLFTPLLPSTTVGTISNEAVTVPIRRFTSYKALPLYDRIRFIFRGYLPNRVKYVYAAATDIDLKEKNIKCQHRALGRTEEFNIPYDQLVVGVGSCTNTFNTTGVDKFCHYLKQTGDASLIRQNIIDNLEKASLPNITEEKRKKLLSFFVIGGGPTGVEFAAELQDFLRHDVVNPTHAIYNRCSGFTSVTIVQSNENLLPGYNETIQRFTKNHMKDTGINLWTNTRVTGVNKDSLTAFDKSTKSSKDVPYGMIVWATGVSPGKFAKKLISKLPDHQTSFRSLEVDSHLRLNGVDNVWAIGDCADINVLPEYKSHLLELWNDVQKRKGNNGDQNRLSLESNTKFVQELEEHFDGDFLCTKRYGRNVQIKMAKDFKDMLEAAKFNVLASGTFKGLSKKDVADVATKNLKRQKHLPPTAQVAQEQGEWLAKLLNNPKVDKRGQWTFDHGKAFHYQNRGQLVYVGSHMAALAIPGTNNTDITWNGSLTNFFWHAAYFGMLESTSTRYELLVDWLKTSTFGRTTAISAICTQGADSHHDALRRQGHVFHDGDESDEKENKKAKRWLF